MTRLTPYQSALLAELLDVVDARRATSPVPARRAARSHRLARPGAFRSAAVTGALAAAAAGGLVVPVLLPDPPDAAAVELLGRASAAAAGGPAEPLPRPGDVLYVHGVDVQVNSPLNGDLPEFRVNVGHRCFAFGEQWVPVGDEDAATGRNVTGVTEASARTPGGEVVADPVCVFDELTFGVGAFAQDGPGGWQAPDGAFVAGLPTDPAALHDRARADARAHGYDDVDHGTFTLLTDLARSDSPHLTPAVRAAVFGALARVPGVAVEGEATSLFGEVGTLVGHDAPDGGRSQVIIDAATGSVLGSREVATDDDVPGVPRGSVYAESASRVEVVAAVGDRPAG